MRRSACVLLLSSSLVFGCQKNKPEPKVEQAPHPPSVAEAQRLSKANVNTVIPVGEPEVLTQAKLGTKLGSDGNVSDEKMSFRRNEPVYLTMWLKESPAGLQTSVRWYDSSGKQIAEGFKPMNGAKVATFKFGVKKPKAGHYKAVGYWGGNIAAEYEFKVTK